MSGSNNRRRYRNSTELRRKREGKNTVSQKENHTQLKYELVVPEVPDKESASAVDSTILPSLVQSLYSNSIDEQLTATQKLRSLVSRDPNPLLEDVVKIGIVPRLVELLECESCWVLQFEAAWVLTNIASGKSAYALLLIEAGALPIFIDLLTSEHVEVKEQAVWALGNLAGDSPDIRDCVIEAGVLYPFYNLLTKTSRLSLTRNVAWALSNLCRGHPPPDFEIIKSCLAVLPGILFHSDPDVLADACWSLSYLADGTPYKIQAVVDAGVCRRLVELLTHSYYHVVTASLKVIGNIATGTDEQRQILFDCSVLLFLSPLIVSSRESIKRDTCWALANLAAGNPKQVHAIFKSDLFPHLVDIIGKAEFRTRKEAARVISNSVSVQSYDIVSFIVSNDCIPRFCDFLVVVDIQLVHIALKTLEIVLAAGEDRGRNICRKRKLSYNEKLNPFINIIKTHCGKERIEFLLSHENREICQRAIHLMNRYFPAYDEDVIVITTFDNDKQQFVHLDGPSSQGSAECSIQY